VFSPARGFQHQAGRATRRTRPIGLHQAGQSSIMRATAPRVSARHRTIVLATAPRLALFLPVRAPMHPTKQLGKSPLARGMPFFA